MRQYTDDHREDALNFICWGTFETLLTSSLLSFRRRIYTSNWRQNSSNKRTKTIGFMSHHLWYHPLENVIIWFKIFDFFFNKFEVLFTDIYSITTREKTDLNVGNEIQNEVRWNSRTCVGVIERQTLKNYEGLGPGEDCKNSKSQSVTVSHVMRTVCDATVGIEHRIR